MPDEKTPYEKARAEACPDGCGGGLELHRYVSESLEATLPDCKYCYYNDGELTAHHHVVDKAIPCTAPTRDAFEQAQADRIAALEPKSAAFDELSKPGFVDAKPLVVRYDAESESYVGQWGKTLSQGNTASEAVIATISARILHLQVQRDLQADRIAELEERNKSQAETISRLRKDSAKMLRRGVKAAERQGWEKGESTEAWVMAAAQLAGVLELHEKMDADQAALAGKEQSNRPADDPPGDRILDPESLRTREPD